MAIQKKWFIFVLALMSLFAFNVSGAFAQGDDTFCYEFNFAANPYAGIFEVEKGHYEEDLETEQGAYVTDLQPNGSHELSLRYYPTGGFGFYSRVYKIILNVSVPGDSSFRQAVVYSRAFGAEVAWNMYPDGDFAFAPTSQSISSYLDYNAPQNTNPEYNGTLYGETSAPAGWENWVWIVLRNTVPGSRIISARFEGLYTSPFGTSNCDWIPEPQPTNTPTNPPPPSPSPTLTLTPTLTHTPTATATALARYEFTFPASIACHTDPATGVSFFPSIMQGTNEGDSIGPVGGKVEYRMSISERILLDEVNHWLIAGNSGVTRRVIGISLFDGLDMTYSILAGYPSGWSGPSGEPGESFAGDMISGPTTPAWADSWVQYFDSDNRPDPNNGHVEVTDVEVGYYWNSAWQPGSGTCPESYTPTPISSATNTPTATATPSRTPTVTRTPTPSTDQQCGFVNSSFTSGTANWTTTGTVISGAIRLADTQTLSQTLTVPAANVRLTVVTSAIDDDSGSGTAQLAYTSSLGSKSGNMSYTLANFQSVNNQRVYQWYFNTSAGSTTIQFTSTLTGSITGLNILSACLESVSSIPTQTPDPNLPDTGNGGSGGTGGGSDDSGSSGVGFQCGQPVTAPGFNLLNIPVSIGNWILYLARVLLQWFICILLPILQGLLDLVGSLFSFLGVLWDLLWSFLIISWDMFWLFLSWMWGHIANFFNILRLMFQLLWQFVVLQTIRPSGFIFQLLSIGSKLMNVLRLFLVRLGVWIVVVLASVQILINAWSNTGPAAIGVTIHDCVARPLESDLCAFYYIAEFTFLAGPVGSFIVPFITAILYTTATFYIIDFVAKFLKDLRSGSK